MKRKKRYKHATIGKKKYYFYKIVWVDPCGDAGHASEDEMKSLLPATMVSHKHIFLLKIKNTCGHFLLTTLNLLYSQTVIVFQEVLLKKWREY